VGLSHFLHVPFGILSSDFGISLERSPVGAAGLAFDRQWMLVDATTRVFVRRVSERSSYYSSYS
jgi:uncharacterized protein YcbX